MTNPKGPGSPYQLLFSDETNTSNTLPTAYRQIYPGDWPLPTRPDRPFIYTNFAQARDGRISFNEPSMRDASHVTKADPHDRWLMGLLRMRAEAIMVGDVTVNLEEGHIWTAEFIYPPEAEAFAHYRHSTGLSKNPLLVMLSFAGEVDFEAASFQREDLHIVFATTTAGVEKVKNLSCPAKLDVLSLGETAVDLHDLVRLLQQDYGINYLLCEGGARVFANLLDAGLVDEEFVTYCPTFVGRNPDHFRPSYCEGVAWMPDTAPYSKPISMHRAGDLFFLRTQCVYQK